MVMSMENPVISVIIPAYRCAETIGDAIDSALGQDVPVEILVIANDPDGDLAQAMERYAGNTAVRYLCNETNLGASGSRNRGVALAKGTYVAFLDADDMWAEGKLKKQLQALEKTGDVLCCTARELLTPEGKRTGRALGVKERITYRELLKHNCIGCSSVLLKTEVAREFPMGHEDSHEDYILWLQILGKYGTATGINEPLLRYRLSNTGKSGSKLKSAGMTFKVYRYMGFSWPKSIACFCSYALHGVRKYLFSGNGEIKADEA